MTSTSITFSTLAIHVLADSLISSKLMHAHGVCRKGLGVPGLHFFFFI